jgi:hypothetical protein
MLGCAHGRIAHLLSGALGRYRRYKTVTRRHKDNTPAGQHGWLWETLQMPIARPPRLQRCPTSRAVEQYQDRTRPPLRGDATELKNPPALLPGTGRLRLSRRNALRFGSSWLCGLVLPAALAATTRAARSADIRVAFINPWGPPEFWQLVSATMQAAAAELGIEVEERRTERSVDRAIAFARDPRIT